MATCPHCGRVLRITDWKPECPDCGVNLNYYKANDRLLDESEKAEIEHAHFQPKVDRAKAAYAGSWKAILRIVLTLLPVGALFLPTIKLTGNSMNPDNSANAIGIFGYIGDNNIGKVLGSGMAGIVIAVFLLSVAMILVNLILIIMSLGKHGKVRAVVLYGVMLVSAAAALIFFIPGVKAGTLPGVEYDMAPGIGAYLYVALQALSFVWNLLLVIRGIPVKYTQCLIGGLPSEEYFGYVNDGWSKEDIRRKMLVALAKLQNEAEEAAGAEAGVEEVHA